ncbi:MAG: iron ABC transporter permease [Steroidobacteraceae bacterium]
MSSVGSSAAAIYMPRGRGPKRWKPYVLSGLFALPALVPLLVIAFASASPETAVWSHLARYVLPEVVFNTIKLVIGVALLAGMLGTSLAWLVTTHDFPGRRWLEWALLLPLAMPAYVLAFVAVGFLDFSGPLQSLLRSLFSTTVAMPPIRSTGGVILVLSLAFYPYVYLLARSAFLTQSQRALEVAYSFGYSRTAAIWKVVLPLARPWIASGVALVCMETLADFGAVAVFNYNTFTTAIYRAWFGMFSIQTALQLSAALLLVVFVVLYLDQRSRAQLRFTSTRDVTRVSQRVPLEGLSRWVASSYALGVFALAFLLPMLQLIWWTIQKGGQDLNVGYWGYGAHSLLLASMAALIIVGASLVLAYAQRNAGSMVVRGIVQTATLGYAVPGTVLAVGVMYPLVMLNNGLQELLNAMLGGNAPALLLQGTVLGVLLAYMARFLAVGFKPIESGLQRITRTLDEASIGLGVSGLQLVRTVHVPLLRTSLFSAAILVFVDVMKEMPITLLTRPFGWDTLAVRVFNMTSIGEWERAALPALAIVLVGLLPVALLTRGSDHVA